MSSKKYPPEVYEFVKSRGFKKSSEELAEMLNREIPGFNFTKTKVASFRKNHNISSGLTGRFEKGNISWNKGKKRCEFMTPEAIEKVVNTQFKKGNRPHNAKKVGELSHTTDGYLVRKIGDPDIWEFEARLVWEREKGKIPENLCISYLDGNKDNVNIENLFLIKRSENLMLNRMGLRSSDCVLTETGLSLAKLKLKISAKTKERDEHEKGKKQICN